MRSDPLDAYLNARLARTALSLYGECIEFEISVPEGYDESELAAAFRTEGCEIAYITPHHTLIVEPRNLGHR